MIHQIIKNHANNNKGVITDNSGCESAHRKLQRNGENSLGLELLFSVFGQVNLTKCQQCVQNIDNHLTFPNMSKMRAGLAMLTAVALGACSEAGAESAKTDTLPKTDKPEVTQVASLETCKLITDVIERLDCEIAVEDQRTATKTETIDTKRGVLETEQEANEQRRTTIDVLTEAKEIMEKSNPSK